MSAVAQAQRPAARSALGQSRRRAELGLLILAIAITGAIGFITSSGLVELTIRPCWGAIRT